MRVLIDPYMFEITKEDEIIANIAFFKKLIDICRFKNEYDETITIALYKGLKEHLFQRYRNPFPIRTKDIKDENLRNTLELLNRQFLY